MATGMAWRGTVCTVALLAIAGCTTRSISNSDYVEDGGRYYGPSAAYHGELSAYDVLGIDTAKPVSESDIQAALTSHQRITVPKGSAVMLVQSGAPFADSDMTRALERYYSVSSFTGMPVGYDRETKDGKTPYAAYFRLAAAKGGFDTVIVYWGLLESVSKDLGSKSVSWLPIVGGVVPDETQRMRIRLMVAVIDVSTGQWDSFGIGPFEDDATSNQHDRAASDQTQVALLKKKGYEAAADALAERYAR